MPLAPSNKSSNPVWLFFVVLFIIYAHSPNFFAIMYDEIIINEFMSTLLFPKYNFLQVKFPSKMLWTCETKLVLAIGRLQKQINHDLSLNSTFMYWAIFLASSTYHTQTRTLSFLCPPASFPMTLKLFLFHFLLSP